VITFGNFIGKDNSFYDVYKREQILEFLNTKVKSHDEDHNKKWITTWNNYLLHSNSFDLVSLIHKRIKI
jgi:integrase/recombinase XerD